jgi:hypothetical protein
LARRSSPREPAPPSATPAATSDDTHQGVKAGEKTSLIVTGVTNARTEAANTGIKQIKRTGRGYRNASNYRARILLASAARTAA